MSRVAAIGEGVLLAGYALAGVDVHAADDTDAARAAWDGLPEDVACVILTPAARAALARHLDERARVVWAVLPS
jgi:vacuolar-type H+-ATPase subunit F/Vma7